MRRRFRIRVGSRARSARPEFPLAPRRAGWRAKGAASSCSLRPHTPAFFSRRLAGLQRLCGRSVPGVFGSRPASVDGAGARTRARSVLVTSAAPLTAPGQSVRGWPSPCRVPGFAGAVGAHELAARRKTPKREGEEPAMSVGSELGQPAWAGPGGQPPLAAGGSSVEQLARGGVGSPRAAVETAL